MGRHVERILGRAAIALSLLVLMTGIAAAEPLIVLYAAVPDYVPLYLAKDRGIFEKHGLDVKLQLVNNSAVIPPALLSNSGQIAGIPLPVFLQAVSGGVELRMFAGVGYTPKEVHNGSIMARNGADIHGANDLVGKKIGVSGLGSFFHIMMVRWFEERGVDPRKVNFVETPFLQMPDLLKAGQIDAVALGQPFVNRIVAGGIGYEVAPYISEIGVDIPIGGFAAEKNWASAHKDAIAAFKASIHEAVGELDRDPSLTDALLIKYLKMTPEILKQIPLNTIDDAIDAKRLDFWQAMMLHQGLISEKIDTASLILE